MLPVFFTSWRGTKPYAPIYLFNRLLRASQKRIGTDSVINEMTI